MIALLEKMGSSLQEIGHKAKDVADSFWEKHGKGITCAAAVSALALALLVSVACSVASGPTVALVAIGTIGALGLIGFELSYNEEITNFVNRSILRVKNLISEKKDV